MTLLGIDLTTEDRRKLSTSSEQQNALTSLMHNIVRGFEEELNIKSVTVTFDSPSLSSEQTLKMRRLEEGDDETTNDGNVIKSSIVPSTIPVGSLPSNLPSSSPTDVPSTIMTVIVEGRAPPGVDFEEVMNEKFSNFRDAIVEDMLSIIPDMTVSMVVLDLDRPSVSPSVSPSTSPTVSNVPTNIESIGINVVAATAGAAAAGAAAVRFMLSNAFMLKESNAI